MEKPEFHHLSVAPFDLRRDLIKLIEDEFHFYKHHGNGRIITKMNALTDKKLIMKLYEASQADVKIDLIVREFVVCARAFRV